jgi:hypothetical protein
MKKIIIQLMAALISITSFASAAQKNESSAAPANLLPVCLFSNEYFYI